LGDCWLSSRDGSQPWGYIVVDNDGRVVDNTGIPATSRQAWLDKLADQRWPCLAGQTIQYSCSVGE
jgi:hypothetical protein